MIRISGVLVAAVALALQFGIAAPTVAVEELTFDPMYDADVSYDPAVPTPESFLGRQLGAAPVRHHELVEYITMVAEASDRLSVEVIGYSHERRPILFVVATSPENHARLDAIKAQHIALTEPGSGASVTADMPVVTWLNYGVHGAESSGMDASLPTIYHLAAAQGTEIEETLSGSIILVTAIFNPDGHSKRAAWFDRFGGEVVNTDPAHIEHNYDWLVARTNHYGFDLNRQWLLQTQPEPRAWMKKWHEWRPNLTVDYHEMASSQTYYFHPGVETRTNPLVPEDAETLMAEAVKQSEAFLDGEAKLYFHGERFDNFYIGKGSTYPLVNGGVGVLYEAGAALGRAIETPNGIRTYHENVRKHFRTSLASARSAFAMRARLLAYQKQFYDSALSESARASQKAYVFAAPNDPARTAVFLDLLGRHRIKAYRLGRDVESVGQSFAAATSYIVPVAQPQYRLIRGIFETASTFEDATFYDVSSWTIPLSFDLDYAAITGRAFRADLLGAEVGEADTDLAAVEVPDEAPYAYVFGWDGYYAPRALSRLLGQKLLAKVATKPFSANTTRGAVTFARGSILVPLVNQPEEAGVIYDLLARAASEDGVFVHALTSGAGLGDGVDLGGPAFSPLKAPKAVLLTSPGPSWYESGEVWHLMDYRMKMPVTLRPADKLGGLDLSRYTHIILPGGNYKKFDPKMAKTMRSWVRDGGTIVAMRQGAKWARENVLDYKEKNKGDRDADKVARKNKKKKDEADQKPKKKPRASYAEMESDNAIEVIGGTIFGGDLDITHPIGFGYRDRRIASHRNWTEVFKAPENPYATVIRYLDEPVLSGYASEKNRKALAGTAALIAERKGKGSVILFADDPNFRGIWYGTNKLFLNALFFSKAFEAPRKD